MILNLAYLQNLFVISIPATSSIIFDVISDFSLELKFFFYPILIALGLIPAFYLARANMKNKNNSNFGEIQNEEKIMINLIRNLEDRLQVTKDESNQNHLKFAIIECKLYLKSIKRFKKSSYEDL